MTPEQAGKCGSCVQIPWALTATGVAYNVPGVKHDKLHLSGPVIAEIYLGKITKWNNPKIKKLNPKLHLPASDHPGLPQRRLRGHLRFHELPLESQLDLEEHDQLRDLG